MRRAMSMRGGEGIMKAGVMRMAGAMRTAFVMRIAG